MLHLLPENFRIPGAGIAGCSVFYLQISNGKQLKILYFRMRMTGQRHYNLAHSVCISKRIFINRREIIIQNKVNLSIGTGVYFTTCDFDMMRIVFDYPSVINLSVFPYHEQRENLMEEECMPSG